MKIEESPFSFANAASLEKLKRSHGVDAILDDLDLTFMDFLGAATALENTRQKDVTSAQTKATDERNIKPQAEASKDTGKPKLRLVEKSVPDSAASYAPTEVDPEMTLERLDLSDLDIQYLKQGLIPHLPIVMGNVPIVSVFPSDVEGKLGYRGHEISPKLTELIEKGYKTGRPIRVEVDASSSVILKIRNGQVSAEFVSNDKTAAFVMQQELDDLRHRLALKNLPVGTLEYKYQDGQRQSRNQEESERESDESNR